MVLSRQPKWSFISELNIWIHPRKYIYCSLVVDESSSIEWSAQIRICTWRNVITYPRGYDDRVQQRKQKVRRSILRIACLIEAFQNIFLSLFEHLLKYCSVSPHFHSHTHTDTQTLKRCLLIFCRAGKQLGRPRHRREDNIKIDFLRRLSSVCLQSGKVYRCFRGACCLYHQGDETPVNHQTTRHSIPEDSHLHTRRRQNFDLTILY
jgi:hypothetical protein